MPGRVCGLHWSLSHRLPLRKQEGDRTHTRLPGAQCHCYFADIYTWQHSTAQKTCPENLRHNERRLDNWETKTYQLQVIYNLYPTFGRPGLVKLARSCRPPVGCLWVFVYFPAQQMRPPGGAFLWGAGTRGKKGARIANHLRLFFGSIQIMHRRGLDKCCLRSSSHSCSALNEAC